MLNVNNTPVQEEMRSIYTFSKQWRCPISQAAERIADGKLDGFMSSDAFLRIVMSKSKQCELLKVHTLGNGYGWAFPFPRGSPYRETINKALYGLQDQGTLLELKDQRRPPGCPGKSIPAQKDLTVYIALFAALLVLLFVILLVECVVDKCRGRSYIVV